MSGWSWVFGALVIVGLVILIVVLLRVSRGRAVSPSARPDALPRQILDRRLADGDLTAEEYRERLAALGIDS
ncbi:hypothetical protein BH10ACT4_BH10ACT4_01800 [soil metagenome]